MCDEAEVTQEPKKASSKKNSSNALGHKASWESAERQIEVVAEKLAVVPEAATQRVRTWNRTSGGSMEVVKGNGLDKDTGERISLWGAGKR